MNEKHRDSFKQYAIKLQAEEERVMQYGELKALLDQIVQANTARMELLKKLCYQEDGSFGAVAKEGITTVTGTLAGIYAKMREHSVCRMVRDDIIALDVASVSYGMMLTLGLSIGHEECADLAAELAGRGVKETPSLILALTDLLPIISAGELAADAPLINPAGVQIAGARIRDACNSN